jgi:hypothetical protein
LAELLMNDDRYFMATLKGCQFIGLSKAAIKRAGVEE